MKGARRSWQYITPVKKPPKKLGVVVAFDIETEQVDVNKQVSSYKIKQQSKLLFGTACAYVYEKLGEKKKVEPISSRLGFEERIEDYYLFDELYFEDRERFTRWVLRIAKKFQKVYVFAHNTSFDIRESVDFTLLRKEGYEIKVFNPQSKQFIITFEKVKEKQKRKWQIIFADTLNLYPSSLEKVGKLLGMEKLENKLGLDRANLKKAIEEGKWELVLKYNIRDTQITATAVIVREKVINSLGGQLRLTNPSTAMDLFRRRFLKVDIKRPGQRLKDFVRRSYFGGRTEVFFRGIVTTPQYRHVAEKLYERKKNRYKDYGFFEVDSIHYLDINSMYSYSMKYFPSPLRDIGQYGPEGVKILRTLYKLGILIEFDPLDPLESIYQAWKKQLMWLKRERPNFDWESVERELESRRGTDSLFDLKDVFAKPVLYIAEATVHVKKKHITEMITPLPVKMNNKLVFPQGTLSGVWTQMELSLLNSPKDVEIRKIHRIVLFEADWIFIEYINTFYAMKNEAKQKGDSISYMVSKLMMNSLYGKWAEKKKISVVMSKEEFADFIMKEVSKNAFDFSLEIAFDLDYGTLRVYGKTVNALGGYYEVKVDEYYEPYSVSVATFVTSTARSVLRAYIYRVKENGGLVFYCDTDSLIVDNFGYEALTTYIDRYKLGYLDEEIENIAFLEVNTLKDYKVFVPVEINGEIDEKEPIGYIKKVKVVNEKGEKEFYLYEDEGETFWVKYKLKGVPLSKARAVSEDDDVVFKVERLAGLREFLKYKTFGLYWIEQEKELKRVYDKAANANGWVEPYYL